MTDFYQIEDANGYRSAWNVWPNGKIEIVKNGVPLSIFYTPTKNIENLMKVQYQAVRCQKCQSVLNPYDPVDFNTKQFQCCICGLAQQLPAAYREITNERKPAELHPQYRTIEYEIPQGQPDQKIIIFCVDICVEEQELVKIKESLQLAIDLLPETTKVGIITFGTTVNVHELKFQFCPRKVIFRGTVDINPQLVDQYLALKQQTQRFVLPICECRESLTQIIEDLHVDLWTVQDKHRPFRATGVAVSIAISMAHCMNAGLVQQHKTPVANVTVLSSGPCTSGPGQIVDTDVTQAVRHWPDIEQKNQVAKYVKDSKKFYEKLSERANECQCAVNVFSCSIDQIGLYEMQPLCLMTGGAVLISESFAYQAFVTSWRIYIEAMGDYPDAPLKMQGCAQFQIGVSQNIKINGILGPVFALKTQTTSAASNEIGCGGTDRWAMAQLDTDTTLLAIFDLADQPKDAPLQNRFVQFRTDYTCVTTGKRYLRVTTTAFRSDLAENIQSIRTGFDQEAAVSAMARLTAWRFQQTLQQQEALHYLDRVIIKLARVFCQFVPNDPGSVRFQQNFEFFPQFLYHFRRSDLMQLFGQSPDQTIMKHHALMKQTVSNMLSMVQPALIAYTVQDVAGQPVFLDSSECTADRVLLMDSFFNLLVWSGSTVAAWRNAGYHEKPEYANVKALIEAPEPECEEILRGRFPGPRYDHADQGTSQARILLARVNPSSTHKSGGGQGEVVATDDANMQQFLDVLKKTVVIVEK